MTTTAKESGSDTAMSFGPQEWQWYLQEQDLLSSEKIELEAGAPIKSLDCLPPTATILRKCLLDNDESASNNTKDRVAQGLVWLRRSSFQDIPVLQTALVAAQSQKALLDKRSSFFESNVSLATQEWKTMCIDFNLPDSLMGTNEDICQAILDWQETHQASEASYREEIQSVVSQHDALLQDLLANYLHVCKHTHQQPLYIGTLQNVLSKQDDAPTQYTIKTCNELRMELEELLSFLQSRRSDCSKHTVPAFMTLVTSDDVDTLKGCEEGLTQVLNDLNSVSRVVVGSNELKLLEIAQDRLRTSKERVKQNAEQTSQVENKIQTIQDDIQWCQERIESIKTTLEQDIATLLRDDDSIVEIKFSC